MQAYLFGTVVVTIRAGAPFWHRRLGLIIVSQRTNEAPTWSQATRRWLALLALWPIALACALANRRGPHDVLAGTVVRSRSPRD